jgi:hypothetical protein
MEIVDQLRHRRRLHIEYWTHAEHDGQGHERRKITISRQPRSFMLNKLGFSSLPKNYRGSTLSDVTVRPSSAAVIAERACAMVEHSAITADARAIGLVK